MNEVVEALKIFYISNNLHMGGCFLQISAKEEDIRIFWETVIMLGFVPLQIFGTVL
jgi:hypothetical protein